MPSPRIASLSVRRLCALAPMLIALAVGACDTSSAGGIGPRATLQAGAPVAVGAGPWERVALPVPVGEVRGYVVAPDDPATMLACSGAGPGPSPMTLWRTTDAGAHWARYGSLAGTGEHCNFSIAQDDPRRMTVQIAIETSDMQPCSEDSFYLSGDGGATWKELRPHTSIASAQAGYGWCDLHVTRAHLFLVYSFGTPTVQAQVSLLERSDDDGRSWVRADNGLGNGALFFMPQVGPDERLALTVVHLPAQPQPGAAGPPTELWTSADSGTTWNRAGDLPEEPGTFLLSSLPVAGSTWPTADHPFYALEDEQIPSDLYRTRVLASADGVHWSLLPELPVPNVSDQRRGVLQVLAALPDGRLAAWGASPQSGVPAANAPYESQPRFWLWLWDLTAGTWQVVSTPLDVTADEGCGLCWQADVSVASDGGTYLYASYFDASAPNEKPLGLFRLLLPPA